MARSVATVFGGSGFIGRYVVQRLAQAGHVVRIGVRDPEAAMACRPMGSVGQVVPLFAPITRADDVRRAVEGAEIVINLVGILAERKAGDFQRLHADAAGAAARAAALAGVSRFVQMSALGASAESPSLYARSKAAGEAAVLAAFPQAVILRPSVVFGKEDKFFNMFAKMAQMSPVMPVLCGDTRFQPVYVGDVADAVMVAPPGVFELGGPSVLTMRDILHLVMTLTGRKRAMFDLPMWLARVQASLLERLPGQILTRDQLLLLGRDNVVSAGSRGLLDLGIVPTPVAPVVSGYLQRYRKGGPSPDRYSAS